MRIIAAYRKPADRVSLASVLMYGWNRPVRYKSEDELKKALEIDSWRNLSRDKMIRFAAMMPDMDTELALKIVEQFPEFKRFALEALDVMEKRHESTLSHNRKSQEDLHQTFQEVRAILKDELNKEDLSWDQRKYLIELIVETGNREFAKDSENKRFLDALFTKAAFVGVAAISLGIIFVGGRVLIQGEDGNENREES